MTNKEEFKKLVKEIIDLEKELIRYREQFITFLVNGKITHRASKSHTPETWTKIEDMERLLNQKREQEAKMIRDIYGF